MRELRIEVNLQVDPAFDEEFDVANLVKNVLTIHPAARQGKIIVDSVIKVPPFRTGRRQ